MSVELTATVASGVLMILSVIIGNIIITKNQYKNRLNETISKQRIIWIDTIRNELAKYISSINMYLLLRQKKYIKDNILEMNDTIKMFFELSSRLILRLNPREDHILSSKIEQLSESVIMNDKFTFQEYDVAVSEIVSQSRNLLKNEWEKVKKEVSSGKIHIK